MEERACYWGQIWWLFCCFLFFITGKWCLGEQLMALSCWGKAIWHGWLGTIWMLVKKITCIMIYIRYQNTNTMMAVQWPVNTVMEITKPWPTGEDTTGILTMSAYWILSNNCRITWWKIWTRESGLGGRGRLVLELPIWNCSWKRISATTNTTGKKAEILTTRAQEDNLMKVRKLLNKLKHVVEWGYGSAQTKRTSAKNNCTTGSLLTVQMMSSISWKLSYLKLWCSLSVSNRDEVGGTMPHHISDQGLRLNSDG